MHMLRRGKKMTRMQMKMMLINMTVTSIDLILKVMAMKVLRIKTFANGKILN